MPRFRLFVTALLLGGALASTAPTVDAAGQDAANPLKLDIALKTTPAPGQDKFEVTIKDAAGKPVTDVEVSLQLTMIAMPSMKSEVKTKLEEAKYTGSGQLSMAGDWSVTVIVKKGGKQIAEKKSTVNKK